MPSSWRGGTLLHGSIESNLLLPFLDLLVFLGAFGLLFSLRTGQPTLVGFEWDRLVPAIGYFAAVYVTVWTMGGYRMPAGFRRLSFAAEFILAVGIGSLIGLAVVYTILTRSPQIVSESRSVYILASIVFVPIGLWFRVRLAKKVSKLNRRHPYLAVGTPGAIEEFSEAYAQLPLENPLVLLPIREESPGASGIENELRRPDLALAYQAIVVCSPFTGLPGDLLEKLVQIHFRHLPVINLAAFYSSHWRQVPVANLDLAWALEQDFSLAERSYYRYLKGIFDRGAAILGLIVFLPFILLIAIAIKLVDGGPVIFNQTRVGRGRKIFSIHKFRTMNPANGGSRYTSKNDPRVTRLGRFLRLTRLDELPQLINILKGEMSLIGPRAEWDVLVEEYEKKIPAYHLRHLVKPGLTGWAQLNYPYGANLEDAARKLAYDLYYLKYYSPILDLEIILKTVLSMVSFRGR